MITASTMRTEKRKVGRPRKTGAAKPKAKRRATRRPNEAIAFNIRLQALQFASMNAPNGTNAQLLVEDARIIEAYLANKAQVTVDDAILAMGSDNKVVKLGSRARTSAVKASQPTRRSRVVGKT
jgi:hypothetical protein